MAALGAVTLGVWPQELLLASGRPAVLVNQAGYRPSLSKRALLMHASGDPGPAVLIDADNRRVVADLVVGPARRDPETGARLSLIDFTGFDRTGRYVVRVGAFESSPFLIDDIVFDLAFVTMLRTYYFQRCGVAVEDPITGLRHGPCHQHDAIVARADMYHRAGEWIDAAGGWHDAGDYGKYVGPTAVTIGRLLSLYEQTPELFADGQMTIPESGNGTPDLLDEMSVGLDWLLRMQRPDGAVYRKLSGAQWPGEIMPEADRQQRYVYGVSSPDTAKAAAAWAMGARVYRPLNPRRAAAYLEAARRAWAWLQTVPKQQVDWAVGDDDGSGKYLFSEIDNEESLLHDLDDRLWAAAELYLTTGDPAFEAAFADLAVDAPFTLFEWKDPSVLGLTDYLFASVPDRHGLRPLIRERLLRRADAALARAGRSGYRLAIEELKWGSNKMVAEEGITLVHAYRLTGRLEYLTAAVDQLDYLLGRNAFNKSFVTGIGANPVLRPHNRLVQASGVYLPGYLVNGPFPGAMDGIAPKGRGPLSYVDDPRSYATNENAIDYNASMIGLMGLLMAVAPVTR